MKNVVIPDGECRSLAFYLALEEYLAKNVGEEILFVWRVPPTVIIGRNQILENEVNLDYCAEKDIRICRRKSGGGCVYSDMGNIMISYISERGDVSEVFDRYLTFMTSALSDLGLDAVRSGRNDILVAGRKVSGNALHQMPDRSVVHGTLLYDADMTALEEAIRPPYEKLARHGVGSVRQRVSNLSVYSSMNPALESADSLTGYLLCRFTDGEIVLDSAQTAAIEEMSHEYSIH